MILKHFRRIIPRHFSDSRTSFKSEELEKHQKDLMSRSLPKRKKLTNVSKIILVASGKGGVGKSTTAVNLAASLQHLNKKVGVLDADIYGPSIPHLLNLQGMRPELDEPSQKMIPLTNYGLCCMSMGFLIKDKDAAAVWRGPMVMGAIQKMMFGTLWPELDILILDMPPGTGDIHLSVAQNLHVDGAVIVSTPQELALADARKGITMFKQVSIPLLGLVENMNHILCQNCGTKNTIYGSGKIQELSRTLNVPVLGAIPMDAGIMEGAERGRPLPISEPESDISRIYLDMAQNVVNQLSS